MKNLGTVRASSPFQANHPSNSMINMFSRKNIIDIFLSLGGGVGGKPYGTCSKSSVDYL